MVFKNAFAGVALGLLNAFFSWNYGQSDPPEGWQHEPTTALNGVSTQKAYELLQGRPSMRVLVAVIDTGVDPTHEDLKPVMWVNRDEIPNNGVDDDQNGYFDDVHGWNFLGNPSGTNLYEETLEETRIVASGPSFHGSFETFARAAETFQSSREDALENLIHYTYLLENLKGFREGANSTMIRKAELQDHRGVLFETTRNYLDAYFQKGQEEVEFEGVEGDINQAIAFYRKSLNHYYNPKHEARTTILGSDKALGKGAYRGNPDVKGPDASHGTHVAGIIAAVRDNALGIQGIADNVQIMAIRVVPDGDERDRDVADAIRYAVDNGAKIINMSFGKAFSWDKSIVDEAVKYAQRNDVLLVHAAGNSALELDGTNNFPNPFFERNPIFSKPRAKNWIEVGAITYHQDESMVAGFSNYGKEQVDLFAPGYQILSTLPENQYGKYNGTSMAAPMVTGVAAMLRSYFPKLSASEVKEIIIRSATPVDRVVRRPSDKALVAFKTLSKTGAILNAESAIELAIREN